MRLLLQLGADPLALSPRRNWSYTTAQPLTPSPYLFGITVPKILKEFINHGVDLSWFSGAGNILWNAARKADYPIVKTLLEVGMDPNVGGPTNMFHPLNCALDVPIRGFVDTTERRMVAELLIEKGADPNVPFPNGDYPIHRVVVDFQKGSIGLLIPDIRHDEDFKKISREHFRLLISRCSNIDVQNRAGKTALRVTFERQISYGCTSGLGYAQMLLEAGADAFLPDHSGETPYAYALGQVHSDCFHPLLHFFTSLALKVNRVQLIPAKIAYEQAYAEHCLKLHPQCRYYDAKTPLDKHIRSATVRIFLDVKHALEEFSWNVGPVGLKKLYRSFWEQHGEEIVNPAFEDEVHMVERGELCKDFPNWVSGDWQKWRQDQAWMR